MPRARSPNRDKAYEIYKHHKGNISLIEIAKELKETDGTIRGWKSKDKWDDKLNGTFQTKNTERSEKNKPKERKNKKNTSSLYSKKNGVPIMDTKQISETNSIQKNRGAPKGNINAKGNKGGKGAPTGNKNALTTGEYESILFADVFSERELKVFDIQTDLYLELEIELKHYTIREYRMQKRIKELKNKKGGMSVSSVTKIKSKTLGEFDTETNTTETVAKNVSEEILKIEDALTRVQAGKARIIDRMHKISMDHTKLELEKERLEIFRYKQMGIMDIDNYLLEDLEGKEF